MIQNRAAFISTFVEQIKQILIIHAVQAETEVLTIALGVSVMLSETEVQFMMTDFTSWVRGGTYSSTEKQLTGYISNQEVIGSANITVTINALVDPTEIAASPEFNTSYTAGDANIYLPFQSLTYNEFFAIYGYYPKPTNDNFAGYTSSTTTSTTTTTTHTTTTTTAAPTTTTTTA